MSAADKDTVGAGAAGQAAASSIGIGSAGARSDTSGAGAPSVDGHSAPFPTLESLRAAHLELLDALPESEADGAGDLVERVSHFVHRAAATGAHLNAAADRRAAQGLIDYWTATMFSLST